ncbi:MAG TPA: hypothetical protein DDZ88_24235 [Verrucomicrobiales bacterium]|nr:hypothetical protein [Verrucomicrobiales bacterium]
MPDSPKTILLAGAIGGAAPSLLTLALNYTGKARTIDLSDLPFYLIGTLILSLLGTAVAWGFEEKNRKKAVMLGVSIPALLSVGIKSLPEEKGGKGLSALLDFSLVPSAYAQVVAPSSAPVVVTTPQASVPGRTIELSTGNNSHDYTAVLLNSQGKEILSSGLQGQKFLSIPLPEDASSVYFKSGDATTKQFPLSSKPGVATAFEIDIKTKRKLGFLQAFGVKPVVESTIDAEKREVTPPAPGTEGWVYLGKRTNNAWETLYAKLPSQEVPSANTKATVTFPLKLRSSPGSDNQLIGVLPAGHSFTILETKSDDQKIYWARVKAGP